MEELEDVVERVAEPDLGAPIDMTAKASAVWPARGNLPGGGHAVTAVGYLTADDLADPTEQHRGMLQRSDGAAAIFDRLAAAMEPEAGGRIDAAAAADEPDVALRDARAQSQLGAIVRNEGGIVLFRNSWGTRLGDLPIGVDGFQSMTFEYFLVAVQLVTARVVPPFEGDACAPSSTLERPEAFFASFADRAADLGWRASAVQVLSQMALGGAPGDSLLAAQSAIAECR
jgi:hypothetical protein